MKTKLSIFASGITCLLLTITLSCQKDPPKVIPTLSTTVPLEISSSTVTSGGNVTSDGGANVIARGLCWSRNPLPTVRVDSTTTNGTGMGIFTSAITGLSPARKYYLRAYATNSAGSAYGEELNFTTLPLPLSLVGGGMASSVNFYHFTPKLITPESEDVIILEVKSTWITSQPILQTTWLENIQMVDDGSNSDKVANDNVYTCRLSKESILKENNSSALNKPILGRIYFDGGFGSIFAEVWNSNIPETVVTKIADNIQRTIRVVNIATGSTISTDNIVHINKFYNYFGDNYDYITIIYPGMNYNRYYGTIANSILGIGRSVVNYSSLYGSSGRLRGLLVFPNTAYYDGADIGYQHELGHTWINFLKIASLKTSAPHWPLSDLANGIMGFSPGPGQGLLFPFNLIQQSENSWLLQSRTDPMVFNDLDLYLMGLIPPTEVKPHIVFENSNQTLGNTAVITGPVTTVTIDDIIKEHGPRIPTYEDSPKNFKIATIIVSYYPLTQKEMSFYEYYTQRAELTNLVQVRSGLSLYLSNPFYLSTGKRATLDTKL